MCPGAISLESPSNHCGLNFPKPQPLLLLLPFHCILGERSPSNVHLHRKGTSPGDPTSCLGPNQNSIHLALMAQVKQVAKQLIPFKHKSESMVGWIFRKLFTPHPDCGIILQLSSIKAEKANSLIHSWPLRTGQKKAKAAVTTSIQAPLCSHSVRSENRMHHIYPDTWPLTQFFFIFPPHN